MNKRMTKKRNTNARCFFLAGKSTSIERGYLAVYFNKYPLDFKKARKWLKRNKHQELLAKIKKDVRNRYKHSDFSEEKMSHILKKLRYGNFIPYIATDAFSRAFVNLKDIEITERKL